ATGDLLDVRVDVGGAQVAPAPPVLVCEQLAATTAAALELADDVVDLGVDDRLDSPLAALRRVVEHQRVILEQLDVLLGDRREPVALVLDRIVLAADAEEAA